jgi:predicted P-loop ATPase
MARLLPDHRAHLQKEGFTDEFIEAKLAKGQAYSLDAQAAYNRNFKAKGDDGKWQFSSGLILHFTDTFAQIRCDNPPVRRGKPAKYLTPLGAPSAAYIPKRCVAVTEGIKDAWIAEQAGVAVGAMAGVSHYKKALKKGSGYCTIFDSDGWHNPQVMANLIRCGVWLQGKINLLPPIVGHPKGGMCEWFAAGGTADALRQLIATAYTPQQLLLHWPTLWSDYNLEQANRAIRMALALAVEVLDDLDRNALLTVIAKGQKWQGRQQLKACLGRMVARSQRKARARTKTGELEKHESRLAKQYKQVRTIWGTRIKLNLLTKNIELDGRPLDPDEARLSLVMAHDIDVVSANAPTIFRGLAKTNAYHPVKEYLEQCHAKYGDDKSILDGVAVRYLGATESIYQRMFLRQMIAAVARIFEPGCQVKTALILTGDQDAGKSTFFKVLASPPWFDDSMGKFSDTDQVLKLHQVWFIEWAELENFKQRGTESLKAFISCSVDRVRPPYAKAPEATPRQSIFVGTTNENEFLSDTTGNSRFLVIPIPRGWRIPLELVEAERDRFWAAVVSYYKAGEQWHLTPQEKEQQRRVNASFEEEDVWAESIGAYLDGDRDYTNPRHDKWPGAPVDAVTVATLLSEAIGIPLPQQGKRETMRCASVLKSLGWARERRNRVYWWIRPGPTQPPVVAAPVAHPEAPQPDRRCTRTGEQAWSVAPPDADGFVQIRDTRGDTRTVAAEDWPAS